jgi:5-methylcytosine-specific restriction endonuclease McrA
MPPKAKIPKALREQVWRTHIGMDKSVSKCLVTWCTNPITTFDFEVGHNVPESLGGATKLSNLRPICSRCNKSMGSQYTIDAWNKMSPAMADAATANAAKAVPVGGGCCCAIC